MSAQLLKKIKQKTKMVMKTTLPLFMRKRICIIINQQKWLNADIRYWWTRELLSDLAQKNRNEYHRFLWSNHLAYALTYDIDLKFGKGTLQGSRQIFFSDLKKYLNGIGINPENDIRSVFEIGCSLGYQLRYLETELFPAATELAGVDIDNYAIEKGTKYLQNIGSKISLICDDIVKLDQLLGDKIYDIIISTGTLMYLSEKEASNVVDVMLHHARIMVALSGPAHPEIDNGQLEHSVIRKFDGSFIHNFDTMVEKCGGKVFARKWEGNRVIDGHTIYFVFAMREKANY